MGRRLAWNPMQSSPSKAFSEVKTYTQKNRSKINPAKSAHTYGLRIYIRVILTATNRGYRGNFCSVGCLGGASTFIFTNYCRAIRLFYGVSMVLCFDTEWFFDTPLTQFPTSSHIFTPFGLFWHPIWNWYGIMRLVVYWAGLVLVVYVVCTWTINPFILFLYRTYLFWFITFFITVLCITCLLYCIIMPCWIIISVHFEIYLFLQ